MTTFHRNRRGGFSLAELLVAMALVLFISGILVSMLNGVTKIWQTGIAHSERRSTALAVFGRMSRDLSLAAQPADLSASRLRMLIASDNTGALTSGRYTLPTALFWQAPVTGGTNANKGDLAVVGYFVQWVNDPDTRTNTPKLCRVLIQPNNANDYNIYKDDARSPWISDKLISGTSGAPATRASLYQGELAENVLGLWVRALDENMKPITHHPTVSGSAAFPVGQFDSTEGYVSTATYTSGTTVSSTPVVHPGETKRLSSQALALTSAGGGSLPAALEVAIVTVDSRTARRLTGSEKPGAVTGNLWADVGQFYNALPVSVRNGAEIHSTIIHLVNTP